MGSIAIIKYNLELQVNLTVGKLLASASTIKKQFTKAFTKDEVV